MNTNDHEVIITKQERALISEIYKNGSKFLCLDIPPTKTLLDKKLIVHASVCNESVGGKANYFHFSLSDECMKAINNKLLLKDKIIMPKSLYEKKQSVGFIGFANCTNLKDCKTIIYTGSHQDASTASQEHPSKKTEDDKQYNITINNFKKAKIKDVNVAFGDDSKQTNKSEKKKLKDSNMGSGSNTTSRTTEISPKLEADGILGKVFKNKKGSK